MKLIGRGKIGIGCTKEIYGVLRFGLKTIKDRNNMLLDLCRKSVFSNVEV